MADNAASTALDPQNLSPFSQAPEDLFTVGRHLLKNRRYKEALITLKEAVEREPGDVLYQSYYGLCLVETGRARQQGLDLCRQAARQAFYRVDLCLNLARAHLSLGDRKRAVLALKRGASLEPNDPAVQGLMNEVGRRRSPVFSFLPRGHSLNRVAGRIRHALLGPPK